MKILKYLFGLLIILSANHFLLAQQIKPGSGFTLSHPISYGSTKTQNTGNRNLSVADTFTVYAIMVQFQEDNDPNSSGNGKFDLSNRYYNSALQRDTVIDSPPYDSSYFADHLEFLKNYYYKSSKGQAILKYNLFGRVITLPKQMKNYSPLKNESNAKLGELFKDAWQSADSFINFSGIDSLKSAFVIFHAGVGRDVDLSSIFGYDPTPYDIPSVYLGLKNLQDVFGSGYQGFVTSGGFKIKNSLIIPSTELRELNLISGNILLQLGINGILTASFGSFLGLPDLFNTDNGKTAIGRFGLMDGQSIFSYNGIFPPEPSAWEKVFLGWVNPVVISYGDAEYKLKTSSYDNYSDSSIYKVLISSQEYFLIENRQRDPNNNGQKIYTRNRAFKDSTVFTKDEEGFIYYDISKIRGNLTNVETLDWSLPGLKSDTTNFNGGILIWHIDENVINAKIGINKINNSIEHKGVDLEEAKGSQDIGVTYSTPFGDVTGDGSFVDYWYNGNHYVPSNIYQNKFTPGSYPNSLSYSFANNGVYISDFDTIASDMKFRIRIGEQFVKPLNGFPKFIGRYSSALSNLQPVAFDINGDGKDEFFVNNGQDLYGFRTSGNSIFNNANGLLFPSYGKAPVAVAFSPALNNSVRLITEYIDGKKIGLFNFNTSLLLTDSVLDSFSNNILSAPPLVFDSVKIVLGFQNGNLYERKLNGGTSGYTDTVTSGTVYGFTKVTSSSYSAVRDSSNYKISGNITGSAATDTLTVISKKYFYLDGKPLNINVSFDNITSMPVLADVNKDGKQEIIFAANSKLIVINSNGVTIDNFPIDFKKTINSGICIADVNGDNIFDIIFVTADGNLNVIGTDGKIVSGFPLKVISSNSTPALANMNDTLGILAYGDDGYLYAFKTGYSYDNNRILWKNYLKDQYFSNNNYRVINSPVSYSSGLPEGKVYNWPNPVYEGKTFIRYFINGNASSVSVKILDLAGELVTKLNGTTNANSENEVSWDVSSVQSGIYYGVVEGDINGTKETRIIKIAVIR